MNWFSENRFTGALLTAFAVCLVSCLWLLLSAKSDWEEASNRFHRTVAELNRLERAAPYPSDENLRTMRSYVDDYATALARLKNELKARVLPVRRMAPNEFQSHLRLAMTVVEEKAHANKVKLPDKFYLGFDEFASALPSETAAPLLGQELAQVEWLLDTMIEARVDALTSFRRTPLPEEHGTGPASPRPPPVVRRADVALPSGPKLLERNVIEATFVSTLEAARRVLNQIAATNQQFCIIRLLQIRNEKDKGPLREVTAVGDEDFIASAFPGSVGLPGPKKPAATALNFIVGNERIETSATIEIVRFTF